VTQLFNFEVLGSNTVAELRAIFSCEKGVTCLNEVNHPDELKNANYAEKELIAEVRKILCMCSFLFAPHLYASCFWSQLQHAMPESLMCVENVILSDGWGEVPMDRAPIINAWKAEWGECPIEDFVDKKMTDVRIRDLNLRFGCPYVFIHLDGCEHIVVFKNMRQVVVVYVLAS